MSKVPLSTPFLRPFEVVIWGDNKDKPLFRMQIMQYSEDEARDDCRREFKRCIPLGSAGPLVKRIDVLDGFRHTSKERQRGLFEDLAECCLGESMDDVQGATVNLLLTAVQRRAKNLPDALTRWNELMHRGRAALDRRYTGQTDQRDRAAESEIGKRLFEQ